MDSCKKNIPESNDMWYNAWKQTLYHSASGFRVHRENPGAQFSRRGTMSEGHGIMSVKQTLYHRASGFRVHRENPGAQISRRGTMSEGHGIMKMLCKWKRVLPWTDIADGFGLF